MELVLVPLAIIVQAGISYLFIEKFVGSRDARAVFAVAGRQSLSQSLVRSTEVARGLPIEERGGAIVAFPGADRAIAPKSAPYGSKAA
jgi:hypothetical protein